MIKLSKLHILLHQHIQAIRISVNQLSVSLFSTIITFAVIGIALALPMNLYVLLENIQTVTAKLHTTTQITLYLEKNIQPIQLNNTMRLLKNDIDIAQAQYISPEEGLKTFQKQLHTDHIIEEFKENPLPGVIIVQPIQQNQTTLKVNQLLDRLKRLPFVNDAQLDTIWLQRLNTIITLVHRVVNVLILFFAFTVILVVGNTIRLMTQNRHNEIMVTKMLGGTNAFIRRPFLYSGAIYGLMGSIMAWLSVDSMIWCLHGITERLINLYGGTFELKGLNFSSTLLLLLGGISLGYLGSWFTVGYYTKKIEPE